MVAQELDPLAARRSLVAAYNRELDEHRRRVAEHPGSVERWRAEHAAWRRREAELLADLTARRAELQRAIAGREAGEARAASVEPYPVEEPRWEAVAPEPCPVAVVEPPLDVPPVALVAPRVERQAAALGWPALPAGRAPATTHLSADAGTGWPCLLAATGPS